MYYLLGHKLMELPISVDRKAVIAQNTYLLALDGDIDFMPNAVQLLIDLMKRNSNLAAACGRIHLVGSGLMVIFYLGASSATLSYPPTPIQTSPQFRAFFHSVLIEL
jgi:chitin synthase